MSHWQSEMDRALRDIQIEYDSKLIGAKQEMEDTYALQMQEIRASKLKDNIETSRYREENIRVRSQIKDMKSRISVLELEVNLNFNTFTLFQQISRISNIDSN